MGIKRKEIVIGLIAIFLVFCLIIWTQISMFWSEKACATITHLERSKGIKVGLIYYRNGEPISDRVDISYFKYKNLEELQKKKCCMIQYSIYWPYEIKIIDIDLKAN